MDIHFPVGEPAPPPRWTVAFTAFSGSACGGWGCFSIASLTFAALNSQLVVLTWLVNSFRHYALTSFWKQATVLIFFDVLLCAKGCIFQTWRWKPTPLYVYLRFLHLMWSSHICDTPYLLGLSHIRRGTKDKFTYFKVGLQRTLSKMAELAS